MSIPIVEVKEATDYFRPFPEPESVFFGNIEKQREMLLPLAIVELNYINSEWSGVLPVITPVEPGPNGGVFGESSPDFHNYLCRSNWIAYNLIDGKAEYAGDWRLFNYSENRQYYTDVHIGYQRAKKYFQEHGYAHVYYGERSKRLRGEKVQIMAHIGGYAGDANWVHATDFPLKMCGTWTDERGRDDEIIKPLTHDQRTFEYIGEFSPSVFINGEGAARHAMGCSLIVFYDDKEKIMLTTFDW